MRGRPQRIESFDLPALQPYRTMRRQHEHREQGIFVAEGEKVVRRLLESQFRVVSVLLPEKWLQELDPLLQARREEIQVFVADKALLETLTGFSMYQGLLAVGKVPPLPTLEDIVARSPQPRLLVAADGLTSAENLGALVRNCAAFNAQALIVGETCSSPFLRRAVRSSMGAIFQLPIVEVASVRHPRSPKLDEHATDPSPALKGTLSHSDGERDGVRGRTAVPISAPIQPPGSEGLTLAQVLRCLRDQGIRCIAAHPHADGRTLSQARFSGDCCIVFGSEGYGISPTALAACNEAAAIPMPATVDSLNVGSAAAVFLYEANRQRG